MQASEFAMLLQVTGRPVTFHQIKPPQAVTNVRAIVQSNIKSSEAIVNAYGVGGRTIQIAANALPTPPEKFDIVTDANGERWVLELVVPKHAEGSGAVVSYTCFSKGRA